MAPGALARDEANFRQCLADMWPQAQARGISQALFNRELEPLEQPDMSLIDKMRDQPEFEQPLWSYIDNLVTNVRVQKGKQMMAKYASLWPRIEQRFGVDRYILVALWAVESNYGGSIGGKPIIASTATLSCIGRRKEFFRNELFSALEILQAGDVPSSHLRGSWAGAFGHTQFMPSTFKSYAVDFDGDGKKNIVDSVADSLASTANNLKRDGWESGKTWGYEVKVPGNFDFRSVAKPTTTGQLDALGVTRANGQHFPRKDDAGSIIIPVGVTGPKFFLMKNFSAIRRYNGSEAYAYAVGHLADRIRGAGAIVAKWPRHIRLLTRPERQEMQQRLTATGFDTGGAEGRMGAKTREAVKGYQQREGLVPDGFATPDLLQRLRNER